MQPFLSGALGAPFIQRLLIMENFRLYVKQLLQKSLRKSALARSPLAYG
jgi:hypothetical protein